MTPRLDELLRQRARAGGSRFAVEDDGGPPLTWADLDRLADRRAGELEAAGLRPGGRAVLVLPRTPDFLGWLAGCWRAGGVAVPLEPTAPPPEIEGLTRHAAPSVRVDPSGPSPAAEAPSEASPEGDALLLYTSGSTGRPRAVRHSHGSILASLHGLAEAFSMGPDTRTLGTLPLSSSHGLFVHALPPLVHGGTLVLAPLLSALTIPRVWRLVQAGGVSFATFVPAQIPLLVDAGPEPLPEGLVVASASAPLTASRAAAFAERFDRPVLNCFGMTETAGWFLYGRPGAPPSAVGRPGSCRVKVVEGELHVRGAQVTPGYWRDEEATRAAFRDGWLRTGDLARIGEDGEVHLAGRLKRTIQHLGRSVQPEEIEEVLAGMDEVEEAAVVGVDHPVYGEAPRAFLVLRPGADLSPPEVLRRLRKRLAPWRVPRWVHPVDSLPRTRTGKVDLDSLATRPPP